MYMLRTLSLEFSLRKGQGQWSRLNVEGFTELINWLVWLWLRGMCELGHYDLQTSSRLWMLATAKS